MVKFDLSWTFAGYECMGSKCLEKRGRGEGGERDEKGRGEKGDIL